MSIDSAIPLSHASGSLDCPRCGTSLKIGRAAFYLRNEYVGMFDSLICDMCHYSLLTSSGYDAAMIEAAKYGLVGQPELLETHENETPIKETNLREEKILEETVESSELKIFLPEVQTASSDTYKMVKWDTEMPTITNLKIKVTKVLTH